MRIPNLKYIFENRALVLMYHKINIPLTDPWNLSVSPENFEAQLKYLKKNYTVVSSEELVRQIKSDRITNKSIVLTFDDGYLDNYQTAKPLLEKYSIPATFFITDSYLEENESFWWDELEFIIVQTPKLPSVFSVSLNDKEIYFDLKDESVLNDELHLKHKNYTASKPPTLRTQLYIKLWKEFSGLQKIDQQRLLELIREWAKLSKDEIKVEGAMSKRQLKLLSESSLFTIGGHTKSHPSLNCHSYEIQHKEIKENQYFLENLTKKSIDLFAFPSGNYNAETLLILRDSSYTGAFTTLSKPVNKHTNKHLIPRVQINNWDRGKFSRKISSWFKN